MGVEVSDESLSVYVRRLLSQGYSREQISESLRKSGYPESLIDATFRALESGSGGDTFGTSEAYQPVNQQESTQQSGSFNTNSFNRHSERVASLATYIKTYLQQGYQRDQLYSYLLHQNYSKREVDDAFSLASGKVIHEVHVAGSTFVKLAVLILFIAGITTFLFLFLSTKGNVVLNTNESGGGVGPVTINHLLDLSLNLDESSYEPGAKMNAEIGATNMGTKQRFDVIFLWSVVGSDGTEILSGKETRALTDSISFNKRIFLPEDTHEGEFNMRVKAEYDGKEAIASQLFNVEKSSSIQNNSSESNTSDSGGSSNGGGTIIIIKDEPPNKVMDEANNAAKSGDSVKAEKLCTSISNKVRRDQCLNLIVLSDNESSHCDAITSVSERESCYMLFIFNGKYTLCSKLTTQDNKNLCENLKHLHDLPASSSSGGEEKNINDFT